MTFCRFGSHPREQLHTRTHAGWRVEASCGGEQPDWHGRWLGPALDGANSCSLTRKDAFLSRLSRLTTVSQKNLKSCHEQSIAPPRHPDFGVYKEQCHGTSADAVGRALGESLQLNGNL